MPKDFEFRGVGVRGPNRSTDLVEAGSTKVKTPDLKDRLGHLNHQLRGQKIESPVENEKFREQQRVGVNNSQRIMAESVRTRQTSVWRGQRVVTALVVLIVTLAVVGVVGGRYKPNNPTISTTTTSLTTTTTQSSTEPLVVTAQIVRIAPTDGAPAPDVLDLPPAIPISAVHQWYKAGQAEVVLKAQRMELDNGDYSMWTFTFDVEYCTSFGESGTEVMVGLAQGPQPMSALLTSMPPIDVGNCPSQDLSRFTFEGGSAEETFPVQVVDITDGGNAMSSPRMDTDDGTVYVLASDPSVYLVSEVLQEILVDAAMSSTDCTSQAIGIMNANIWEQAKARLPFILKDSRVKLEPYTGELLRNERPFVFTPALQQVLQLSGSTLENFTLESVTCG